MNILKIKETCIYVSDLHRTKQFYNGLLQLPVITLAEGQHIFFKAGDSVLLCFIAAQTLQKTDLPPHGATGSIHFAFEVAKSDYEAAMETIKRNNITITHQQKWKGQLKSFYFNDPDNNLVEIIEEGLWDNF